MLARPVLLYDGECAFCRSWVSRLQNMDRAGAVKCIPSNERREIEELPTIGDDALDGAIHLVTAGGEILVGARSAPEILRHIPRYRWLGWLFIVPGVPAMADLVYSAIAKRRHRFGCGSDRCRFGLT